MLLHHQSWLQPSATCGAIPKTSKEYQAPSAHCHHSLAILPFPILIWWHHTIDIDVLAGLWDTCNRWHNQPPLVILRSALVHFEWGASILKFLYVSQTFTATPLCNEASWANHSRTNGHMQSIVLQSKHLACNTVGLSPDMTNEL